MMKHRPATPREIIDDQGYRIRSGLKISYRHFLHERAYGPGKHGVKHVQFTSSKITLKDGLPHVRYMGDLVELTATHYTTEDGTQFLSDYRIKSEYLKSYEDR